MSEQINITLPSYQWEAILRGLASSGWDSMHAVLTEKLAAAVVAEEPEWEYGVALFGEMDDIQQWATEAKARAARQDAEDLLIRRRKAGPWGPVVEQEGEGDD